MKELESINNLFTEIEYLQKRSSLLEDILVHYDKQTMTFNIPEKWKDLHRISLEGLRKMPKSPRHAINKAIYKNLPYVESEKIVNWDKLDETATPEDLKVTK